jgi:lysozyme family protein
MGNFLKFLPGLLKREGGYVDNPLDVGSETYAGVARTYNPRWAGWPVVDAAKTKLGLKRPVPRAKYADINKVLAADVTMPTLLSAFYKPNYWDVLLLDGVKSQALAEQMADHSASAGPSRPAAMIQFAVNQLLPANKVRLTVDGVVGPKTIAAINAADPDALLKAFVHLRRQHYLYRTATAPTPPTDVVALFKSLKIYPDSSQRIFLASWLARLPKL